MVESPFFRKSGSVCFNNSESVCFSRSVSEFFKTRVSAAALLFFDLRSVSFLEDFSPCFFLSGRALFSEMRLQVGQRFPVVYPRSGRHIGRSGTLSLLCPVLFPIIFLAAYISEMDLFAEFIPFDAVARLTVHFFMKKDTVCYCISSKESVSLTPFSTEYVATLGFCSRTIFSGFRLYVIWSAKKRADCAVSSI